MQALLQSQLKDGRPLHIREAFPPDAATLNELITQIIGTSAYTLTTPAELDLSEEAQANRIHQFQKRQGSIILLAESEGQLVGNLEFKNEDKLRVRHSGEIGMGVLADYRGLGIGRLLLEVLLRWGQDNPLLDKICLSVYADNAPALALYQKLGFIEEGRLVKSIKLGPEQYADTIMMYKWVG